MRIALIGPFGLEPKTTARVRALPLARALAGRGHQVALFLPPFHTPEAAGKRWEEDGVTVENVRLPRWALIGYLVTGWRLARRALAWRPDVIHCFKPKGHSGVALWLLWWRRKLSGRRPRLVLDSDDWEGWGGWNELEPYPHWQKMVFAWQERWGLTHADAVSVASRALQTIVWSLGVPRERVHYLPNGVARIPSLASRTVGDAIPTILLLTRFFEFDVRRVVALLRRVREQVPAARLLVVGKGFFGEEDQLLAEAAAAGLQHSIEYAGWVQPEQLTNYFSAAGCAIYPFDDTLLNRTKCPIKLVELMAAGVPLVAEAVGQIQEYVQHGRSGLLVAPGDDGAFAGQVVRMLQDAGLRAELAAGARERIAAHFTWDKLAGTVEQAYHL